MWECSTSWEQGAEASWRMGRAVSKNCWAAALPRDGCHILDCPLAARSVVGAVCLSTEPAPATDAGQLCHGVGWREPVTSMTMSAHAPPILPVESPGVQSVVPVSQIGTRTPFAIVSPAAKFKVLASGNDNG